VFANATIIGGKTTRGAWSVIGSNVWLTQAVGPDTVVVLEKPVLHLKASSKPAVEALMYHF
jgi:serine O-acetyltransferase